MKFIQNGEQRDKISYYKAIKEGDNGNDTRTVKYITTIQMTQYTCDCSPR